MSAFCGISWVVSVKTLHKMAQVELKCGQVSDRASKAGGPHSSATVLQGLALVHFPAQPERFTQDELGCFSYKPKTLTKQLWLSSRGDAVSGPAVLSGRTLMVPLLPPLAGQQCFSIIVLLTRPTDPFQLSASSALLMV